MLLFVPWRKIPDLLQDCKHEADVVARFQEQRRTWKAIVQGLDGRRPADVPSEEAFAYLTLRHISNLEMMSLKRDDKSAQVCTVAPVFANGMDFPEGVEASDDSDADFPHPQMGEEDGADEVEEGLSDAEEQSYHTQKATFPLLTTEVESILPRHDNLPTLVVGSEETRGAKQEEAYINSYLSIARHSLPSFSTTATETGFEGRPEESVGVGGPVNFLVQRILRAERSEQQRSKCCSRPPWQPGHKEGHCRGSSKARRDFHEGAHWSAAKPDNRLRVSPPPCREVAVDWHSDHCFLALRTMGARLEGRRVGEVGEVVAQAPTRRSFPIPHLGSWRMCDGGFTLGCRGLRSTLARA